MKSKIEPYEKHIMSIESVRLPDMLPKINNMALIEETCPNCNGTGIIVDGKYSEDCMKCQGYGKVYIKE